MRQLFNDPRVLLCPIFHLFFFTPMSTLYLGDIIASTPLSEIIVQVPLLPYKYEVELFYALNDRDCKFRTLNTKKNMIS